MAFTMSPIRTSVHDHASALAYFHRCTPWRGESGETSRPLLEPRRRTMSVNLHSDGSVAFQLHRTEVVTYHPDNTLTLDVYATPTTDAFARSFMPHRVMPAFVSDYVYAFGRYYRTEHHRATVIDLTRGEVVNPLPWQRKTIDRARARQARNMFGLTAFKAWYQAVVALGHTLDGTYHPYRMSNEDHLRALADQSRWLELVPQNVRWGKSTPPFAKLDKIVLQEFDRYNEPVFIETEPVDFLLSHTEVAAYRRAWRQHGEL